jgi:hypothetical protein
VLELPPDLRADLTNDLRDACAALRYLDAVIGRQTPAAELDQLRRRERAERWASAIANVRRLARGAIDAAVRNGAALGRIRSGIDR